MFSIHLAPPPHKPAKGSGLAEALGSVYQALRVLRAGAPPSQSQPPGGDTYLRPEGRD